MTNERLPPRTYIMGKITKLSDGSARLEPFQTVLGHQARIRELIRAAETYAVQQDRYTLNELKKAALRLRENM